MLETDTMTLEQAINILDEEDETNPEFWEATRYSLAILRALATT